DVSNIYQVPSLLLSQNVCDILLKSLNINKPIPKCISKFDELSNKLNKISNNPTIKIGIVGKYTGLADSYLSLTKALKSAGLHLNLNVEIIWIESCDLEPVKSVDKSNKIINEITEMKDDENEIEEFETVSSESSNESNHSQLTKHENAWNNL